MRGISRTLYNSLPNAMQDELDMIDARLTSLHLRRDAKLDALCEHRRADGCSEMEITRLRFNIATLLKRLDVEDNYV